MQSERISLTSLPIVVKTYDIDYVGIVHNAVYIRWLEDLRSELILPIYPIEAMIRDGISPVLTRTEIEYRLPVRLGETVTGLIWVTDLGRARWTLAAEIKVGEQVRAFSRQQGTFVDMATQRPVRIPSFLREVWN